MILRFECQIKCEQDLVIRSKGPKADIEFLNGPIKKRVSQVLSLLSCSRPTRTCSRRKTRFMCKTPVPSPSSAVDGDAGDDPPGQWNKLTLTIGGGSACARIPEGAIVQTLARKRFGPTSKAPTTNRKAAEFLCLPEEENLFGTLNSRSEYLFYLSSKTFHILSQIFFYFFFYQYLYSQIFANLLQESKKECLRENKKISFKSFSV